MLLPLPEASSPLSCERRPGAPVSALLLPEGPTYRGSPLPWQGAKTGPRLKPVPALGKMEELEAASSGRDTGKHPRSQDGAAEFRAQLVHTSWSLARPLLRREISASSPLGPAGEGQGRPPGPTQR